MNAEPITIALQRADGYVSELAGFDEQHRLERIKSAAEELAAVERERAVRAAVAHRAIVDGESLTNGFQALDGVLTRWKEGTELRSSAITKTYSEAMRAHEDGNRLIDFHALPFDGKVLFLAPFLDIKVGGAFPRYDFDRSNVPADEHVFISHHGAADVTPWVAALPLINRYLGGAWKIEPVDGTSVLVARMPALPAVIPFTIDLLRKGRVLFGYNQHTGYPYYVPLDKLTHILVGGQSGVGKSVLLNQCLRSLLFNLEKIEELVLIDLKGGVELSRYKHLSPKIRFIKAYDELPDLAESLVATMYERLDALEQSQQLSVTTGFRIVIIDEFAAIQQRVPKNKDEKERHQALLANLNLLSQQARAAGIKLWAQLQKPTADNMDTSFRTNLQSVLCFFMPSKVNATSMFGELDGLPADPTRLGKGEFVFRDDAQNRTVLLKSTFCDENDIAGIAACIPETQRVAMPPDEDAHP